MELTKEMLDEFKATIEASVAKAVEAQSPATTPEDHEELKSLVIKQGEAIQALGETLKKSVEESEVVKEAVSNIADTAQALIKFTGADGSKKSLDGEEGNKIQKEAPVEKSAALSLDELDGMLSSALPTEFGGGASRVSLGVSLEPGE